MFSHRKAYKCKFYATVIKKWIQFMSAAESSNKWSLPAGHETGISVYNSLTKCKVPLILPRGNVLTWYMCGPTVYDDAHIGHASCYVKFDILRRILENVFHINVVQLMGITDIDDKIISRSKEKNVEFWQLAKKYENDFFKDLSDLGVLPPTVSMRVSDSIPAIIEFIKKIVDRQFAYAVADGSVYFDSTKYGSNYAKLSPTIESEPYSPEPSGVLKKQARDFALWKGAKPDEPWWDSPWGKGRPGWHIECSTMASQVFGNQLDFHTGGIDLLFPHHENELAQSGAYHCVPQWVNYWLHSGHVHLKNEKMSKSLKNVITIQDFLEKHSPNEFRIYCLRSHYRNNIDYTDTTVDEAAAVYGKLQAFNGKVKAYVQGQYQCAALDSNELLSRIDESAAQIKQALADDFDTNRALEIILNLVTHVNKQFHNREAESARDPAIIAAIGNHVNKFLRSLGISLFDKELKHDNLESIIDSTVKFRTQIRLLGLPKSGLDADETRKTMLGACDRLRKELGVAGVIVKDLGRESSWTFELPKVEK